MLPSMFFDTTKSPCEVTASEAVEAGLKVPMTWLMICRGHMQSFTLLALKLSPCIEDTGKDTLTDRRLFVVWEIYN